ncbi:DNA-binding response regulator, OmpR family, contains REC and winged-helix (wHTH) domain [Desulfonispora thiosulfatigenes DSM 11270]|uniref:Stage 0 sporulation protein A homolog n=1 Tax=Desulfonispora thiosulfatigenes DSM 11270 TaxID=656914 RepID=A0A1W1VBF1_DESTI|nr:response regulator transcription factor [Desulfonispora thiosulfatigenes]SMB90688.1 DNA-binding response regulator, OmpR family, contains REC and winged-helix (wHTH) domain [Desulfonispora thiosulfatigenes DSM 11270]
MEKILIIEDEDPIRELIKLNLQVAGYETLEASDGSEGLEKFKTEKVDLVLLDIMLPKVDGYEILPQIIKKSIPVILLTAKDGLQDKVKGLDMGADDYVTKPFEAMELLARIKAVLRRSAKDEIKIKFDDIEIYLDQHKVVKEGEEIELTFKEFDLLRLLAQNKGMVMSRDRLLQLVWDYEYEGNTRTVDMHIQRLRNKLGTDKIKTVYKVGYRLED